MTLFCVPTYKDRNVAPHSRLLELLREGNVDKLAAHLEDNLCKIEEILPDDERAEANHWRRIRRYSYATFRGWIFPTHRSRVPGGSFWSSCKDSASGAPRPGLGRGQAGGFFWPSWRTFDKAANATRRLFLGRTTE